MFQTIVVWLFIISLFLFCAYFLLVTIENKKSHRFLGGRLRFFLDRLASVIVTIFSNFWQQTIVLYSRYCLHFVILKIMSVTVVIYEFLENLFYDNRQEIRKIRLLKKNRKNKG